MTVLEKAKKKAKENPYEWVYFGKISNQYRSLRNIYMIKYLKDEDKYDYDLYAENLISDDCIVPNLEKDLYIPKRGGNYGEV